MSCSWNSRAAAVLLFLVLAVSSAHAAPMIVKMATLAPEGSSWYRVLQEMGESWKKASDGTVTLRIYPGGVVGDEDAMIRKMRVGQLQAAAITGIGLAYLDRGFYALHVPMMYASDEEFDYVRDRISPLLEKRLEEKGLVVLNWGDAGWVRFFAQKPFTRPAEVKAMKLFVWGMDTTLVQLYKETGFQPVPLSAVDILPGLQTGLINAFDTTPLAALAFQWFGLAPNMADVRWAPLTGATVIDRKAWLKIPEGTRTKILEASRVAGLRLRGEIRRLNEDAIQVMVKNGLKIHHVPPDAQAEWRKIVEDVYPRIRGSIIPAEMFDAARKYRDEYRASRGGGKGKGR
ncbi:MAG: C4-dicarboxylate ABC transporter substrate-binding protein [Deltaproteobacteria bacterium]|nr:C4-dicarboxylate ABC transporter substrate-binding protein [Deltaproteobacteria bacterium]